MTSEYQRIGERSMARSVVRALHEGVQIEVVVGYDIQGDNWIYHAYDLSGGARARLAGPGAAPSEKEAYALAVAAAEAKIPPRTK